ncbi:MAG: GNAT family N-acetyltransferase [Burkholderiales bacterium]|nr:GNAT family N-acetyltransferase [Burkholderiales bacterium]
MTPADIESIERATLAAVSPQSVEEFPGWLLPFDSGTVGRARSAVPLRHAAQDASLLGQIESRYRERGLPAEFRLPATTDFSAWCVELRARGYQRTQPTLVQVAATQDVRGVSTHAPAQVDEAPDEAWAAVFLGEGFDPVDGASRVAALSRAPGSLFASVRQGGKVLAGGAGAFAQGWASVHGMRTAQSHRGQGLAGRVLAGLADAALKRGYTRTFLQVDAQNAPAIALYKRAGFETAWTYEYWRKP